jgi:DNA (cytosine-5)-methyltransferase 1
METVMTNITDPLDSKANIIKDPLYGFSLPKKDLTDHFYDTRVRQYDWERAKRLKEDHGFMGKMSFPEKTNRTSRTITATY